jgi:hypothetical protein
MLFVMICNYIETYMNAFGSLKLQLQVTLHVKHKFIAMVKIFMYKTQPFHSVDE